jgi:hypothetical protein
LSYCSFIGIDDCCHAADIKDATGRIVTVPEQVRRVLAAGPTAARPDGGFAYGDLSPRPS